MLHIGFHYLRLNFFDVSFHRKPSVNSTSTKRKSPEKKSQRSSEVPSPSKTSGGSSDPAGIAQMESHTTLAEGVPTYSDTVPELHHQSPGGPSDATDGNNLTQLPPLPSNSSLSRSADADAASRLRGPAPEGGANDALTSEQSEAEVSTSTNSAIAALTLKGSEESALASKLPATEPLNSKVSENGTLTSTSSNVHETEASSQLELTPRTELPSMRNDNTDSAALTARPNITASESDSGNMKSSAQPFSSEALGTHHSPSLVHDDDYALPTDNVDGSSSAQNRATGTLTDRSPLAEGSLSSSTNRPTVSTGALIGNGQSDRNIRPKMYGLERVKRRLRREAAAGSCCATVSTFFVV